MDEMTRRTDTRFLVITHHAVTMSRMDRLFGVTMVEQGVSQLVSVDLKRAEALVAWSMHPLRRRQGVEWLMRALIPLWLSPC